MGTAASAEMGEGVSAWARLPPFGLLSAYVLILARRWRCWGRRLVVGICLEPRTMLPSIRIDSWKDWTRVYNDVLVWRPLIDAICVRDGVGHQQIHPASANTVFPFDRG